MVIVIFLFERAFLQALFGPFPAGQKRGEAWGWWRLARANGERVLRWKKESQSREVARRVRAIKVPSRRAKRISCLTRQQDRLAGCGGGPSGEGVRA